MSERNANSTLAISLAAGLAGAGLALLLAPRSGRETRARIRSSATDMKDQAEDKLSTARHQLDHGVAKARNLKSRLTSAVKKEDKTNEVEDTTRKSPVLTTWNEEM